MRTIAVPSTKQTEASTSTPPPTTTTPQRNPWHSPMPYLFGGLAAMMGLIAFALLILACSYWKLSERREEEREREQRDLESGGDHGGEKEVGSKVGERIYEENVLVIMAGDNKPTFLATPVRAKASCLGQGNGIEKDEKIEKENGENCEKIKEYTGSNYYESSMESQDFHEVEGQNQ